MLNERLRRVTDLFIEGTELYFGLDETQAPVVMWVNKLNSFETEEARRDGMVKRGIRVAQLTAADNPEVIALMAGVNTWDDDKLAEKRVTQLGEELYLEVLNDIEAEDGWREKVDMIRRGTSLLDDEDAPADDPRRATLTAVQVEYIAKVNAGTAERQRTALIDLKSNSRQTNLDEYVEYWRNRASLDIFMQERRVSEMFAALRDCKATIKTTVTDDETMLFDHVNCNHAQRLLAERKDVYALPESVIKRAGDAIDGVTVPMREAGNSGAPASSSASLEPSSVQEELSTPSIPAETPVAVLTT